MHCLNLYFPENLDCRVQEVVDISNYDPDMEITNPLFTFTAPGNCDCTYQSLFRVKGKTYITSNTLGFTDTCASQLMPLPDGLYEFFYSVCPNDDIKYSVKILRTCQTECRILSTLSSLELNCDDVFNCYGTSIKDKAVMELNDMWKLLREARVDAQNLKFTQANNKLQWINQRLNSFTFSN